MAVDQDDAPVAAGVDLRLRLDGAAREVDAAAPTERSAVSVDGGAEAEQPVRVHLEDAPESLGADSLRRDGLVLDDVEQCRQRGAAPLAVGSAAEHVDGLVDLDTAARVDL